MPVTLTINGHTIDAPGDVALRLPPSGRRPRADVLRHSGQVQGVHRRGDERDGAPLAPTEHEQHLTGHSGCRVSASRRRTPARSSATRCAAARCASNATRSICPSAIHAPAGSARHPRRRSHPRSTVRRSTRSTARFTASRWTSARRRSCCGCINLETGELVADASFENPQRFGGSDVMSRIHYDTEHRGKLLLRTLAGYLTHAIEEFPVDPDDDLRDGRGRQLHDARPVLPAERLFDRPEPVPVDHRDRDGGGKAHDDQPDGDRAAAACCRFIPRRASTACRSSAATSAPTLRRACSPSTWPTRSGSSPSWTSVRTRSSSSATGTASWPRRAPPVRRSRAGRSPAACRGSMAPSRMSRINDDGAFRLRRDRRRRAEGICGSGLVDLMSELLRTGPHERDGTVRGRRRRVTSTRRTASTSSKATSTSWRRPRAPTSPGCRSSSASYGIPFDAVDVFYLAGGFGRHLEGRVAGASG